MRRLLASLAVVTLGGCDCITRFDRAYDAYCIERCDGGTDAGMPGGPPVAVRFEGGASEQVNALDCNALPLVIVDADDNPASFAPPVNVALNETLANTVDFFLDPNCDGGVRRTVDFVQAQQTVYVKATKFGQLGLSISSAVLDGGENATFRSIARLRWSPAGLYVPPMTCEPSGAPITLRAFAIGSLSIPVLASADTDVPLTLTAGFEAGSDGGCLAAPVVRIPALQSGASLNVGAVATSVGAISTAPHTLFDVIATARLDANCLPAGDSCPGATMCCSGTMCMSNLCCLPSGAACTDDAQCCNGCNGNMCQ
jgi:hypothetical protein